MEHGAPKAFHATRGALFAGLLGTVVILAAVIWAVVETRGLAGTVRTEGTVTARSASARDVVAYNVAGQRYTTTVPGRHIFYSYSSGQRVPVAYAPDDPADARVADFNSLYSGPLFIGGFGVLLLAAGGYGYRYGRRKSALRTWLLEHGQERWVPAEHTRVRVTAHDSDSGRPAVFVLQAGWVDPVAGRSFFADSANLRSDPTEYVRGMGRVRVLYDPADPSRNLLELESATW